MQNKKWTLIWGSWKKKTVKFCTFDRRADALPSVAALAKVGIKPKSGWLDLEDLFDLANKVREMRGLPARLRTDVETVAE